MKAIRKSHGILHLIALACLFASSAEAGNVNGPATPPASGSGMPTLAGIYGQLSSGTSATVAGTFQEPSSGPATGTGYTLAQIAAKLPAADLTNGATTAEVMSGKRFWGLRTDGTWGPQSGVALAGSNVVGGNGLLIFAIPNGIYSGRTATASDTNLVTGNIRAGTNIFGVAGKTEVVDTTTAIGAVAADVLSGKQAYVNGAVVNGSAAAGANVIAANGLLSFAIPNGIYSGRTATASDTNLVTGNIRAGTSIFGVAGKTQVVDTTLGGTAATAGQIANGRQSYVNGVLVTGSLSGGGLTCTGTFFGSGNRWCDQANGTIVDMSSGQVWLKNITCLGTLTWTDAVINTTTTIQNGVCGLTDGSSRGDWRLPLLQEMRSLAFGTDPVTCSSQAFLGLNTANAVWSLESDFVSPTVSASTNIFNAIGCIPSIGTDAKTATHQVMAMHRK
jgi:hypothetical protein